MTLPQRKIFGRFPIFIGNAIQIAGIVAAFITLLWCNPPTGNS
jgi:hypothetical protein